MAGPPAEIGRIIVVTNETHGGAKRIDVELPGLPGLELGLVKGFKAPIDELGCRVRDERRLALAP